MSVDVEASIIVGIWLPEELWDILKMRSDKNVRLHRAREAY